MKSSSLVPSITDVLKKISDDKSLTLFNSIAVSNGDRNINLREMNLSEKQYYSRLSGLMDAGLIRRLKGKYSLTLVGKIVYDAHLNIGKALSYYWKLKAIESMEVSSPGTRLPKEELTKLIDALIDNHFIKDFLIKESLVNTLEEHHRHQNQESKEENNDRIRNFRLKVSHRNQSKSE
jgi:predicted transcriptional regulator